MTTFPSLPQPPVSDAEGRFNHLLITRFFQILFNLLNGATGSIQKALNNIENGSQYPVGAVYLSASATDPKLSLGFGVWSNIGTTVIGTTTLNAWQRTL